VLERHAGEVAAGGRLRRGVPPGCHAGGGFSQTGDAVITGARPAPADNAFVVTAVNDSAKTSRVTVHAACLPTS